MKKLFTLFALLVAIVTGAWGEELAGETIFNLTTVGDGTATVGTFETSGITKTAETAWTLNGTTPYITINLTEALKAGDIIEISGKSNSSNKFFRFYNSTTFGKDYAGAEIGIGTSEGVKQVVVAEPSTATNTLIGKTTIYMNYSSGSNNGTISYIKIKSGSTATTALSSDKTWSYTIYDAPTTATTANFVNSQMLYGKGIKMQTSDNFQEEDKTTAITSALLNLNYDHSAGFDAANGGFIMFKLPANSKGIITVKYIPSAKTTTSSYDRILGYKIGSGEEQTITNKGYRYVIKKTINFDVTNESDVYFYNKSSNNADCFIYSVEVTFTSATLSLSNVSGKAYGFGGYCGSKNFTVTNGTAYKASFANSKVVLTSLDGIVPAGEGVVIAGDPGANATINFTDEAADVDMDGNNLHGTTVRTLTSTLKGDYAKFITLQKSTGKFIPYTGEYFPANRAYMLLDSEGAAQSFDIVFDSETGVDAVAEAKAELGVKKVVENGKLVISNNGKKYNAAGAVIK